ncbi:28414_t:CDS:2 [Dentiscutata erythropus]|uniref:28414_t:CDS:1 n=1 Tax=Dentiscutata erythropus TaxID=1348616 RepID=A0A9N9B160_9GLOM|nr:28414_t:CDS:2 [Dentiscutata erythropus]
MFKLGLKLLDKKRESKSNSPVKTELPSALPAFEWQVTGDSGLGDLITKEKEIITLPEVAIFGTTNERKIVARRVPTVNNGRTSNAESNRLRLLQIIENEDARNNFQDYLKSQYCEENLDFYMDVVQYRDLFSSSGANLKNDDIREISSTAKYIWNYYLDSDTSSKPLNVPQDLANQCRQKIDSKKFTDDIFDKLQQHCFDLMVQDSLPKFLRRSVMHENFSSSNSSITSSYLKPSSSTQKPLFGPRRSLSSGSLKSRMASTLASIKTADRTIITLENKSNSSFKNTKLVHENRLNSSFNNSFAKENRSNSSFNHSFAKENRSNSSFNNSFAKENRSNSSLNKSFARENRSNSSFNSSFGHENKSNSSFNIISTTKTDPDQSESNRSSTVSTDSTSSSPSTNSSLSTNSLSSRISLSNIKRRVLTRRRNSTSLASTHKTMDMPGSYPCTPVNCDNCDDCDELDLLSRDKKLWHKHKLRRNMSTANFQSDSKSKPSIIVGGQVYVADKTIPQIPTAIK